MSVFASIGGNTARYLCLHRRCVPYAPSNVARLPKTISHGAHPIMMLDIRHPANNPGIAAGVNIGRIHRASENLTWITPEASPVALVIMVKMT